MQKKAPDLQVINLVQGKIISKCYWDTLLNNLFRYLVDTKNSNKLNREKKQKIQKWMLIKISYIESFFFFKV